MNKSKETKIAIIGLGYVGLPLAIAFSAKHQVVGFDINEKRIADLQQGLDHTGEADVDLLKDNKNLSLSANKVSIEDCTIYIVTVPTPIDAFKAPDLRPLLAATKMIGQMLKPNDLVIYESTVYPGCTEEDCVPVLESHSGLSFNFDFFCGYSPERINPGDKINTLTKIKKITSGSTEEIATRVDALYASIIVAGTYLAPSIKVAEAAKAIENAQRDVNISFVNELALIFDRMGIDTNDVLAAAGSKWNFLPFKPGLVGGHCIGVDPYYLAHKAQALGYHPQVILSGRQVNDNMGVFIANKLVKLLIKNTKQVNGSKVLILGVTFKENCPDIRNTKVIDIVRELKDFGVQVDVYDPQADEQTLLEEYQQTLIPTIENKYDGIVLAVAHDLFKTIEISNLKKDMNAVVYDIKSLFNRVDVTARL